MTTARERALATALVAVHLAGCGAFILRTSFPGPEGRVFCLWDDAMISMHYARNLVEGHGLVWNPGEAPVQGISNPGVALVMAALHLLPLGAERVSLAFQALNALVLVAILFAVFRLAGWLAPGRREVAWAAAGATALAGPLAWWSLMGSDMGVVTLWLLIGVLGVARAEAGRPGRLAGRFAALAPGLLLRPDVALFYALLIVAAFALPRGRRAAVVGLAALGLVLGAWLALGLAYYGDPLPNPFYLKATGHPRGAVLARGAALLGVWLPGLALPLLFAAVACWRGRARVTLRLVAAIVAASFAYALWVGGDWLAGHGIRFLVPMLPLLFAAMADGVFRVFRGLARAPAPGRVAPAGLAAVCGLAVLAGPPDARAEWLGGRRPTLVADHAASYRFARYVARHTAPTTSLGVHWAGVPIYFSRRPGVDFLGRSDRHIARRTAERFRPGHSKWDWRYVVRERRPDLIRDTSRGLAARADFRAAYVQASRPGRDFYVRRDALGKLRDPALRFFDLRSGRPLDARAAPAAPPPAIPHVR